NLGGKMGYAGTASTDKDFLPANLGIGTSYGWVFEEKHKIRASIEVNNYWYLPGLIKRVMQAPTQPMRRSIGRERW
uniref:hypothetical protein n=1 Tax=Enterobacter asburiae TaxID=61645 RepID=UPI0019535FEE